MNPEWQEDGTWGKNKREQDTEVVCVCVKSLLSASFCLWQVNLIARSEIAAGLKTQDVFNVNHDYYSMDIELSRGRDASIVLGEKKKKQNAKSIAQLQRSVMCFSDLVGFFLLRGK